MPKTIRQYEEFLKHLPLVFLEYVYPKNTNKLGEIINSQFKPDFRHSKKRLIKESEEHATMKTQALIAHRIVKFLKEDEDENNT